MTPTPLPIAEHHHHAHATSGPTAELRHEHEVILRALAVAERLGRALAAGEPVDRDALAWILDFFRTFTDRCHHVKEEQHLFPALERRGVPRNGGPIGVMLDEHEEGRRLIAQMSSGGDAQIADAIGRYAVLLRAHIDKENGVLFPLADQVLGETEQTALVAAFEGIEQDAVGPGIHERLLAGLGRLEAGQGGAAVLDVRGLAPRERHPRIFATLDRLAAGEAFVLINDHDPKPLYYQLAAERPGAFTWEYLEEGPDVWRVRMGKPA
jgi:hemerythrin-like domain-containing protein